MQTFPDKFLRREFYEVIMNHTIGIGTIFKKKLIKIPPFETLMVPRALYGCDSPFLSFRGLGNNVILSTLFDSTIVKDYDTADIIEILYNFIILD